jgi:Raf kinase inhibitor-like YbhB/YbcL family protein
MRGLAFGATFLLAALMGAGVAQALTLTSPDIKPGAKIASEQVDSPCGGKNISPALSWSGAPKGTKSIAVTIYDPDAPTGSGFWHWVVFNLPPDTTSLAKNAGDPKANLLPPGALTVRNDTGASTYNGPCPPKTDKPHHYHITVFAVDVDKLDPDATATPAVIGFNLHFHTLAKATLTGIWGF